MARCVRQLSLSYILWMFGDLLVDVLEYTGEGDIRGYTEFAYLPFPDKTRTLASLYNLSIHHCVYTITHPLIYQYTTGYSPH